MILNVGTVRMVFLVWVVGGLLSLAGALTYAELAAAMPGAGGEYVYLTEAYGPLWGFLYSWTQMWVGKSGSIATLATAFFEYTAHFIPQFESVWFSTGTFSIKYGQMFALVLILLLGGINYLGVRIGGDVQVAVTGVKVEADRFSDIGRAASTPTRRQPRCCPQRHYRCRPHSPGSLPRWWVPCGLTTAGITSAWWRLK